MQDNSKTPRNKEGQPHGHWESYFNNDQLDWKGLFINGKAFGKHEAYYHDGKLFYLINYINNEEYGYYEHHLFGKMYYAR